MVYNPIKSDATRVSALLAGDVDLVTDLPVQDVDRLRKETKVKVLDGHEVRTIFIGMDQHNARAASTRTSRARTRSTTCACARALNLAVDREAIKRVVMRGLSIPAGIMVAPGVHGHSKDIDVVLKPDPAGAKKLLAEAGYPDGFEFTLDCPNNRYVNDEKICQALVGMWAKAGIRPKLNSMPFANFIAEDPQLRLERLPARLGRGHLRRAVHAAVAGAHQDHRRRRQLQPRPHQRSEARHHDRRDQDRDRSEGARRAAARGPGETRDKYYYVPIHHQLRPWAMKKNVTTVHKAGRPAGVALRPVMEAR